VRATSALPRLLVITSNLPVPEDSGEPIRTAMFLRALQGRAQLHVLAPARLGPLSPSAQGQLLKDRLAGATITVLPPTQPQDERLATLRRWLAAVASGTPPFIRMRATVETMRTFQQLDMTQYDAIICLGDGSTFALDWLPRSLPLHIDKSNVLAASAAEEAAAASGLTAHVRLRGLACLARRYEARTLRAAKTVSVTSAEEDERLLRHHGRRSDLVLPSAVDAPRLGANYDPRGRQVLWLGSLDYRPNVVGLERFILEGLPVLRRHGLELKVAGSGGAPKLQARLRSLPGVRFEGFVPDLNVAISGVRAGVAPVWAGAGIKLKTLTMMGLGLPLAATRVAAEGVPSEAFLRVGDDAAALAEAIVEAETSSLLAVSQAARNTILREFGEDEFRSRVASIIDPGSQLWQE
jgi:polysaccharide biosynthesis protein PslH